MHKIELWITRQGLSVRISAVVALLIAVGGFWLALRSDGLFLIAGTVGSLSGCVALFLVACVTTPLQSGDGVANPRVETLVGENAALRARVGELEKDNDCLQGVIVTIEQRR